MNRCILLRSIGVAVLMCLYIPNVRAGVTTFSAVGSNHDWSSAGNWDNGVPTSTERAVIPAGQSCTIGGSVATNAYADTIEVQVSGGSVGTLEINYQSSLTLYNATDNISPPGPDNSLINGHVVLDVKNDDSQGAILVFQGDHILTGTGYVRGELSDGAKPQIQIGPWKFLKNQIHSSDGSAGIIGSLTVTNVSALTPSTPHFRNDGGTVSVGYNGETKHHIVIDSTVALEDSSGALWYIDSCDGYFTFNSGSVSLVGDFAMDPTGTGVFEVNQTIATCGSYKHQGVLSVATGSTFAYATFASSPCGNPCTTCYTPPSCATQDVVSAGTYSCHVCSPGN